MPFLTPNQQRQSTEGNGPALLHLEYFVKLTGISLWYDLLPSALLLHSAINHLFPVIQFMCISVHAG